MMINRILIIAVLFSLFGCDEKYKRPNKYKVDLFTNSQNTKQEVLSVEEATKLSTVIVDNVTEINLNDSITENTNKPIYFYTITKGDITKKDTISVKIPLNIISNKKIDINALKLNKCSLYLMNQFRDKLLTRDKNTSLFLIENTPCL